MTVGTDHHPFTRLIDWVDAWAADRSDVHLVVQHGSARPSRVGTNHELLGGDEIAAEYAAADVVISQVGPGTIADANRAGHRPIVVPRDPDLGEVVDDHQVAFGEFMAARGRCICVQTENELTREANAAVSSPPDLLRSGAALPSTTAGEVAAVAEAVLIAPRRRFSGRRLLASLRRPVRLPSSSPS